MWICLNNAFLSVVQSHYDPVLLVVRSRQKEHLENLRGNSKHNKITQTDDRDYRFRTIMTRDEFSRIMAENIAKIDYTNFKDSVAQDDLGKFYAETWSAGIRNLDRDLYDRWVG